MTEPEASQAERADGAPPAAVTTAVDLDRGAVLVQVRRFGWSEAAEARAQALRHAAAEGLRLRLDVQGITDNEAGHLWLVTAVQVNRMARRTGGSLVVVGAPPRMARLLDRLRIAQEPASPHPP